MTRARVLALLVPCVFSCAAPGAAMNRTSRPAVFEVYGDPATLDLVPTP
jgi:hypothetical protein